MEESADLHEEASKENEQTLANLSPAEEAKGKDEVEVEKSFARTEIQKYSVQDYERFKCLEEILWVTERV